MEQKRSKEILQQYGVGPIQFTGTNDALYEQHLTSTTSLMSRKADGREQFEGEAHSIRDSISQRWLLTEDTYVQKNPKQVYYLSMEILLGRSFANNMVILALPASDGGRAKERARPAGTERGGVRCRIGKRGPWPAGRLFHRLHGGREARMNVLGCTEGNWRWRCTQQMPSGPAFEWLRDLTTTSNRSAGLRSPQAVGRVEATS